MTGWNTAKHSTGHPAADPQEGGPIMARHPVPPAYGDLSAAALYVGTSRRTIVRLVESGVIPVYRLGERGNRRVKFSDLEAILVVEEASA